MLIETRYSVNFIISSISHTGINIFLRKVVKSMAKITITPPILRGKAGELRGLRGEHEAVMTRITNLVNGLSDQWSGEAQQAFLQNYQGMQPTFQRFIEILDGYAKLMDTAATEMERMDDEIGKKIQAFQ
jgi:WXG100 family type VII secretion target